MCATLSNRMVRYGVGMVSCLFLLLIWQVTAPAYEVDDLKITSDNLVAGELYEWSAHISDDATFPDANRILKVDAGGTEQYYGLYLVNDDGSTGVYDFAISGGIDYSVSDAYGDPQMYGIRNRLTTGQITVSDDITITASGDESGNKSKGDVWLFGIYSDTSLFVQVDGDITLTNNGGKASDSVYLLTSGINVDVGGGNWQQQDHYYEQWRDRNQ